MRVSRDARLYPRQSSTRQRLGQTARPVSRIAYSTVLQTAAGSGKIEDCEGPVVTKSPALPFKMRWEPFARECSRSHHGGASELYNWSGWQAEPVSRSTGYEKDRQHCRESGSMLSSYSMTYSNNVRIPGSFRSNDHATRYTRHTGCTGRRFPSR